MKKTFFALALLVPAVVAATVKLDVTARCGEDVKEQSCELSANNACVLNNSGIRSIISLEKEEATSAELSLKIVDSNENELSKSVVKATYGEKTNLKCTSEKIDAELTIVVSQLAVVDNAA